MAIEGSGGSRVRFAHRLLGMFMEERMPATKKAGGKTAATKAAAKKPAAAKKQTTKAKAKK